MLSEAPSTLNAPPTKPPNHKLRQGKGAPAVDKPRKCKAQFIRDSFNFKISCLSTVTTSSKKKMNADEKTGNANYVSGPLLLPQEGAGGRAACTAYYLLSRFPHKCDGAQSAHGQRVNKASTETVNNTFPFTFSSGERNEIGFTDALLQSSVRARLLPLGKQSYHYLRLA